MGAAGDYGAPMIRHTVSFRLVHLAGPALLAAIPGVQDLTVSRQVSAKSPFRFQFAMSFADQAAYDAYDAHPDHRGFVAERWQSEVAEFAEQDFVAYP